MKKSTFVLKSDWIINPFLMYAIFWTCSLILYLISPSKINIKLSFYTTVFIIFTIFISYYFAIKFHLHYKNKIIEVTFYKENIFIVLLLIIGYLIEFIYSKNIPFIASITGKSSNYFTFGIPTFHVIIVTYSVIFCVKNMFDYINFKNKGSLFNFLIVLAYFLLIFSRGMLLLLLYCYCSLLLCRKKISIKVIIISVILALICFWIFGILGNLRVSGKWNDSNIILSISKIDAEPTNLFSALYWVEEYAICSIRNLNYNIINRIPTYDINELIYSTMPDFLSKRFFSNITINPDRVVHEFTSSTTYACVYLSFGYIGMLIEFILYVLVGNYISYTKYRNDTFLCIELSLMSFIFALSIFDSMLQYSGYSFAIVWGLLIGKIYFKIKNNSMYVCYVNKQK